MLEEGMIYNKLILFWSTSVYIWGSLWQSQQISRFAFWLSLINAADTDLAIKF